MHVEELLKLPVGSRVVGELQITRTVPGVVELMKDGPHFIRWADGHVTFPFGWIRDYDEYIAARTEIQPSRCTRIRLESDGEIKADGSTVNWDYGQPISK
jgi:hypothetical protein